MFEYFFENNSLDKVVDILSACQNDDGGFETLDYDIDCPCSCLKHTESACRYIFPLDNVPANHPMIQRLIDYAVKNYNTVSGE